MWFSAKGYRKLAYDLWNRIHMSIQWLKITQKVSFYNIASEASYAIIFIIEPQPKYLIFAMKIEMRHFLVILTHCDFSPFKVTLHSFP